jgi:translation initiation factor 3 subunit B
LYWQDKGDFLAVKADRHKKNKNQKFTSFELFRVREKNCPTERCDEMASERFTGVVLN